MLVQPFRAEVRRSCPMKSTDPNGKAGAPPAASAPPPEAPGQRASPRFRGKALRKGCPRSSHADVVLGQPDRDPMALIEESNEGRVERLLPIRFTRMAESAF